MAVPCISLISFHCLSFLYHPDLLPLSHASPSPSYEVQTNSNMVILAVPSSAPVLATIPPLPSNVTMVQLASLPLHIEQVFDITAVIAHAEEAKSVYTR